MQQRFSLQKQAADTVTNYETDHTPTYLYTFEIQRLTPGSIAASSSPDQRLQSSHAPSEPDNHKSRRAAATLLFGIRSAISAPGPVSMQHVGQRARWNGASLWR